MLRVLKRSLSYTCVLYDGFIKYKINELRDEMEAVKWLNVQGLAFNSDPYLKLEDRGCLKKKIDRGERGESFKETYQSKFSWRVKRNRVKMDQTRGGKERKDIYWVHTLSHASHIRLLSFDEITRNKHPYPNIKTKAFHSRSLVQ